MTDINHCNKCGATLPVDWPKGLCQQCALEAALNVSVRESRLLSSDEDTLPIEKQAAVSATEGSKTKCFGDYELLEEIARGGMGIVYKARQKSLDRVVAVKMLLFGPMASADLIRRFKAEAIAAGSLHHPNIVAIHEIGIHDGQHFVVMDHVDGPNLSKFVTEQPLPAKCAASYLKTIAEAIHYAHERGILHRDLKPSNVLIDSNDQPRVTDFGLARRLEGDSSLTLSGQVLGSPSYMPPEQAAASREKVGRRSDVYSLGAMLYHLLAGRPPFVGESVSETLLQVQNQEPISPRLLNPTVPPDLETICLKCLEKEPARRYSTAQALVDELGRFLKDEPILARPASHLEKTWRWCRRKPALAGSLATASMLLLLVAIGSPLAILQIQRARRTTEQNLYAADLRSASAALEIDNRIGARELLQHIADSPRQRALRGWEWRYLMGRCGSDELAILGRHDSWVAGVSFSPVDDGLIASISEDGVVKFWDAALRKEVTPFLAAHSPPQKQKPFSPAHSLAFTPDGFRLATGGADGFVNLWNVRSRQKEAALDGGHGPVGSLAFSADGRLLVCGTLQGWIILWSVSEAKPEQLALRESKLRFVSSVAFTADGQNVFAAGHRMVQRWDVSNPRDPRERPPLNGTDTLATSANCKWVASYGSDAEVIRLWELPACRELTELRLVGVSGHILAFSPDSQVLAAGGQDGNFTLFDLTTQRPSVTLRGHDDEMMQIAFSPDGKTLVSAARDKSVRLWDASLSRDSERILRHGIKTQGLAFLRDSTNFLSVGTERMTNASGTPELRGTVKLWSVTTGMLVASATNQTATLDNEIVLVPGGQTIAVNDSGTLRLYALPSLQLLTNFPGDFPGDSVACSRDGTLISFVGNRLIRRRLLSALPASIGEPLPGIDSVGPSSQRRVEGGVESSVNQSGESGRVALSPDGSMAVTTGAGSEGTITFWDMQQGQLPLTVGGHENKVTALTFSPDGKTLASASSDHTLAIWDVATRRLVKRVRGHSGGLWCVVFSQDGGTLASGAEDSTVRVWNLLTLREVAVLRGHGGGLTALAFSPDRQWLISGGWDGTIRFWRAPSWAELEPPAQAPKKTAVR